MHDTFLRAGPISYSSYSAQFIQVNDQLSKLCVIHLHSTNVVNL